MQSLARRLNAFDAAMLVMETSSAPASAIALQGVAAIGIGILLSGLPAWWAWRRS